MKDTLLELGCDGGSITLQRILVHGIFLFKIKSLEFFEEANEKSTTYLDLKDAWDALKTKYCSWYALYLITIDSQMIDLVREDYLISTNRNEYTRERWLQQLFGIGLGF
jgi:hypothetical protein